MKYFLINLCVHLFVTLLLVILIIIFANRNKHGKTKYPVSYFIPTVLAVFVAFYVFNITGPRLLDVSNVAAQSYYSYTGEIERVSLVNNTLVIDGEVYYFNPMREVPEPGSKVRIRYTRYSKYIIEIEPVDDVDITGVINEDYENVADIPGKTW